nr:hypothetical protein [uncultured Pedobacter sp.]
MPKNKPDRKEELLESAWEITFDSINYKIVDENNELSDEKKIQAEYKIRFIDKNDWFSIARKTINENPFIKDILLAEIASSRFINHEMQTNNLKVIFDAY